MSTLSVMSSKGQIVVPRVVRDQLGWTAGVKMEMVARTGGVVLRTVPGRSGSTAEAARARTWARSPYHVRKMTDEDMYQAVLDVAAAEGADIADMLHLALAGEATAFATFDHRVARYADRSVLAVETLG